MGVATARAATAAPPPPHGTRRVPPPRPLPNPPHVLPHPPTLRAPSLPPPSIRCLRVADWPRHAGRLSRPASRRVCAPQNTGNAAHRHHARRRAIRTPFAARNRTNQLPRSFWACRRARRAGRRRRSLDAAHTLAVATRRPAACRRALHGGSPPAPPGARPGAAALFETFAKAQARRPSLPLLTESIQ